jgi:hypothetical protein
MSRIHWCQVALHTLFHNEATTIKFDKMNIDYCHKDRKHDKFSPDFKMSLHFVRPEIMGGYALTLTHPGSLKRSKFASFDSNVVYGGLKMLVKHAEQLKPAESDGTLVRIEIEGMSVDTETI